MRRGPSLALLLAVVPPGAVAQWASIAPLPEPRARAAGALLGADFYVMGGEAPGPSRRAECWRLDIAGNTWYPVASLPTPGVSNIDAAVVGDRIYLIGGFSGSVGLNRVLCYDPVSNGWTEDTTDPAPVTVFGHACVALNGVVYVIGGLQNGAVSATTLAYDPAAQPGVRWSWLADMHVARQYHAAAVVNGRIWVSGGVGSAVDDEKRETESFDPAANAWFVEDELGTPRGGPAMYNLAGRPYVVAGGWTGWYASGEVHESSGWLPGEAAIRGARTFAYDGNASYLVKAGGWAGGYLTDAEVLVVTPPACLACDANCDGSINGLDIEPFRAILVGGANPCGPCAGDTNHDGSVNGLDIAAMVECLTQ